jgi:hypothetical protein
MNSFPSDYGVNVNKNGTRVSGKYSPNCYLFIEAKEENMQKRDKKLQDQSFKNVRKFRARNPGRNKNL